MHNVVQSIFNMVHSEPYVIAPGPDDQYGRKYRLPGRVTVQAVQHNSMAAITGFQKFGPKNGHFGPKNSPKSPEFGPKWTKSEFLFEKCK